MDLFAMWRNSARLDRACEAHGPILTAAHPVADYLGTSLSVDYTRPHEPEDMNHCLPQQSPRPDDRPL